MLSSEALRDKRAEVLDKVRKMIALADSTSQPGEAEIARAKADRMMEEFSIELWMVEAADENSAARTPIGRMLSLDWLQGHPYRNEIWNIYYAVAHRCRCVVASWKWEDGCIGVVGLEQDIDYFDLMFTHLLAEMGRRLVPTIVKDRDAEWNAWNLRSKHIGWPEVAWELSNAGMLPWAPGYEGWKYNRIADYNLPAAQKWRRAARKLYRDFCRKNGVAPEESKQPATAAKSYAMGWSQEIKRRLRQEESDSLNDYKGSGMEIALRDIREVVRLAVEDIYPSPPAIELTEEELAAMRKRNSRPLPKIKEQPFDAASYRRGANDAKDVDLVGHPHRQVANNPKEITS